MKKNAPPREDRHERRYVRNDDDPASNANAPKPGDTTHHEKTSGADDHQVQGKRPKVSERPASSGPGTADDDSAPARPKTTGTPGGQLGAATENELDRDHAATSEKTR